MFRGTFSICVHKSGTPTCQSRTIAARELSGAFATHPPCPLSLSEDPGLTTYFFPGRDGVGGWGYPGESSSSSSTVLRGSPKLPEAARGSPETSKTMPLSSVFVI